MSKLELTVNFTWD